MYHNGDAYSIYNYVARDRVRFRHNSCDRIVSHLNGCAFTSLRYADSAPKQLETEASATEFIGPHILKLYIK